jgi:hypothetical protein
MLAMHLKKEPLLLAFVGIPHGLVCPGILDRPASSVYDQADLAIG